MPAPDTDKAGTSVAANALLLLLFLVSFALLLAFVYGVSAPVRAPPPEVSLAVESVTHPTPDSLELVVRHQSGESLRAERVVLVVTGNGQRLRFSGRDAQRPSHVLSAGDRLTIRLATDPPRSTVLWGESAHAAPPQTATWQSASGGRPFVPKQGETIALRLRYRPSGVQFVSEEIRV